MLKLEALEEHYRWAHDNYDQMGSNLALIPTLNEQLENTDVEADDLNFNYDFHVSNSLGRNGFIYVGGEGESVSFFDNSLVWVGGHDDTASESIEALDQHIDDLINSDE